MKTKSRLLKSQNQVLNQLDALHVAWDNYANNSFQQLMAQVCASISFNLDQHIVAAALPLFESEKVAAIEWSFDTLYKVADIPTWFVELLQTFSKEKRLIGHGIYFSLFSGAWTKEQQNWLEHLSKVSRAFHFDHITEHFGFMTGENFHQGAPISIPFTTSTLSIGQDRLKRIYNACYCPVGIENLAFSYSIDEVKRHGDFLSKLVAPVNGFIILDLHNLYCQSKNFDIPVDEMLELYPLDLVREIHISGGSWEDSVVKPGFRIRRDTHDEAVPAEVFELLRMIMPRCSRLKYVVLEQLSMGLETQNKQERFRLDFEQMDDIIQQWNNINHFMDYNSFLPLQIEIAEQPPEDLLLKEQQKKLSGILETATSTEQALKLLRSSNLSGTEWSVEKWEPHMVETAIAIAQKWKNGFN